jgi:hypothetical protein
MNCRHFKIVPFLRPFPKTLSPLPRRRPPNPFCPFPISDFLSRIAVSTDPIHLLHSLHESLKFADPFSISPSLFESAFLNPLCFDPLTYPITFSIFRLLRDVSFLFPPIAGEIVPFLAIPETASLSAALLESAVRESEECATMLLFESDLIDVILVSGETIERKALSGLIKWVLKRGEGGVLGRLVDRLVPVFGFLFGDPDRQAFRALAVCVGKCPTEVGRLVPVAFWEFVAGLPMDSEVVPAVLELINAAVIAGGDLVVEVMVDVGVVEWLIALLKVDGVANSVIRIIGNLVAFESGRSYFLTRGLCGTVLEAVTTISFGVVEDYFIFFCRIARDALEMVARDGALLELLFQAAGSCRSEAFWGAFLDLMDTIEENGCVTESGMTALRETAESELVSSAVAERAGAILNRAAEERLGSDRSVHSVRHFESECHAGR